MAAPAAIAIAAHPDDIEFYMAGTLLMLRRAGWTIHYLNIANGSCGSVQHNAASARKIRAAEARAAAKILGATFHASLVDDLEILYEIPLLRKVAAVIRQAKPAIVLTHSPQDYMEDHVNAGRLAVTAAFTRAMPNFKTIPPRPPAAYDLTVYHAMPHGLRDGLRRRIIPGACVNTASVQAVKREALAAHRSQQNWLETSQGFNSYLQTMGDMARKVGRMSGQFRFAEGWRRHLHLGFCAMDADPLREALGADYLVNKAYERSREG